MSSLHVTLPDGGHLNTQIDGPEGAPWIVFSNSVMTDHCIWDQQVSEFSDRYRLLRYDQRGHGGSSLPDGPMTFEQYGSDLLVLLDHVGIKHCTFVGLSMGVPTGLAAYGSDPARFERFVVVDGICRSAPGRIAFWSERRDFARSHGMQAVAEQTVKNWLPGVQTGDPLATRLRQMIAATEIEGFAAATHALQSYDFSALLPTLSCPLLGLAGSLDGAMPKIVATQFGAVLDACFKEIADAGHLPNYQAPVAFNAALKAFLDVTAPNTQKEII